MYDVEHQLECDDPALRERIGEAYDFCSTLTGGLEGDYSLRVLPKDEFLKAQKEDHGISDGELRRMGYFIDRGDNVGMAYKDEALLCGRGRSATVRWAVHEVQGHGYMFQNTAVGHAMKEAWDDDDRYNAIFHSCNVSGEGFATWIDHKYVASRGFLGKVSELSERYEEWLGALFGENREYWRGSKQCRKIEKEFGERNVAVAYRMALDVDMDLDAPVDELESHISLPANNADKRFAFLSSLKNSGIDKDDTEGFETYAREQLASLGQ